MNEKQLIEAAFNARERAYVPYSSFEVGAALLCGSDKVYEGCNIENSSFSLTNCAERTAIFKAVSQGETDFKAIAVVGGRKGGEELDFCPPCGACRQVLAEFCKGDFLVIMARSADDYIARTLQELLPLSFELKMN
ncbi:MAG: cytidine deaminase [Clostridiales bacterium]|nr:cytidine deaminase [Clostridiales bacterium]